MNNTIIPSLLAKNQKELDERISKIIAYSNVIHLDIMDGVFVKNTSLMFDFNVPSGKIYEAHLMMKNPLPWINRNYTKVKQIIVHLESEKVEESIALAKKLKKKTGLAVNPQTFLSRLQFVSMNSVDRLLIMTVQPGKYGSPFLPLMITKVQQARVLYPRKEIEVDGGINEKTIKALKKAEVHLFVVGSYLQKSKDVERDIEKLDSLLKQ